MLLRASRGPRFAITLAALVGVALVALYRTGTAETSTAASADSDLPPLPDKHTKKDPIKANGTIFLQKQGDTTRPWPKPDATLIFTGAQHGYLEPCGCAGLTNQKGGLKRRHTFLKQLEQQGWNPIAMDAGGQIKRFGQQAQIKLERALDALLTLDYVGVGFGAPDLRQDLLGILINFDEGKNPMTSANVGVFGFDEYFSRRFRVVERGGIRVGFTTVLGKQQIARLGKLTDIDLLDPAEALAQVVPQIAGANCDQRVLLVYGDSDEAAALAKQFPTFQWVVAALGADVPPIEPKLIEGTNTRLVEVGHKGMYAVAIGLYKNDPQSWRYEDVPMDHRFADSPEMQQLLVDYQQVLKQMTYEDLGIKTGAAAQPHPSGGKFAGSQACADCHVDAWDVFARTPHSHALKTIVDLDPPRHYDPECLSCHVTGWNPQKYVPYVSGYLSLEETPHLNANGCENCHGPAARHVAAENGEIDLPVEEIEALRQALRMEIKPNEGNKQGQVLGRVVNNCLECHDEDNSPDFDFQLYWPHVEHHGKY